MQPAALQYVREQFAPPTDLVFELVPPVFAYHIGKLYAQMGSPEIYAGNVWSVYRQLLQDLEAIEHTLENGDYIDAIERWEVTENLLNEESVAENFYPLINGESLSGGMEHPLEDGSVYMGGVNGGKGLGKLTLSPFCEVLKNVHIRRRLDK